MSLTLRMAEHLLLGGAETAPAHDVTFTDVCTNSRAVEPGSLFVCIEGERFDGHAFAEDAVRAGAAAVLSSKLLDLAVPVLMVRDTVQAMGLLARDVRESTRATVAAVTGSAGKTTVKEILASVAAQNHHVSRNAGNLNNQIGLPLSIFRADPEADLWVLELGISKPHDMDELGPVAAPDLAVIHNIGPAHLQGLGSMEGVARAKASLLHHLRPDGQAVINADYELLRREALDIRPDAVCYSTKDPEAVYHCSYVRGLEQGRGEYLVRTPDREFTVQAPFCGDHLAENLGAAATAAHLLGYDPEDFQAGLDQLQAPAQRFACRTMGRVTVIDDTYNANPVSMAGAVRTAAHMAAEQSQALVLVLGDMKELGEAACAEHEALGRLLNEARPVAVLFHGEHAEDIARGCGDRHAVRTVTGTDAFLRHWRGLAPNLPERGAVVLFKGSRSCRMEDYVQALRGELESSPEVRA